MSTCNHRESMCVYSAWALSPERGDLDQTSLRGASVRGETARSSHLAQLASECVCVCVMCVGVCVRLGGGARRRPENGSREVISHPPYNRISYGGAWCVSVCDYYGILISLTL